ncbi:hypothetical protein [Sanyastnella coralliicola]|uniref:hypothetical protein n=1 Tax=Sanyastnella coralliicola TaxID=3069118 RepID=UPI0027B899AD|nr:hypothetical protein [Longitalea sp. SCSIO 12813]
MITIGAKIEHPSKGEGVIFGETDNTWRIYFKDSGEEQIGKAYDGLDLIEAGDDNSSTGITLEDVVAAVENVFDSYYDATEIVEMADKWDGGKLILQPGDTDMQGKEIPIDTFFHKIVMMRDRLRVLEQNVNSHKTLAESEKIQLQQYITRIYGSMTTFNVLFKSKNDYFTGEKK